MCKKFQSPQTGAVILSVIDGILLVGFVRFQSPQTGAVILSIFGQRAVKCLVVGFNPLKPGQSFSRTTTNRS